MPREKYGRTSIEYLIMGLLVITLITPNNVSQFSNAVTSKNQPRTIIDNSQNLIIPEGDTLDLSGQHNYTDQVIINGTLKVNPYDGVNNSTGSLYLNAESIYLGPNGKIIANGRGYGGGGGITLRLNYTGGAPGGTGGKGGNGDISYSGAGGGGGSNGGLGAPGVIDLFHGKDGDENGGGDGGSSEYCSGGSGGPGFGGGGGGGAESPLYYQNHLDGGGGGGGGGSGGKNAEDIEPGDGGGPYGGAGEPSGSEWANGENGGYMAFDTNGDSTIDSSIVMGSGGGGGGYGGSITCGGGGGGGGAGGGAIGLNAENISMLGSINTTAGGGGIGSDYSASGGGGAGGGVLISGDYIFISGATIDTRGRDLTKLTDKNGGTIKVFYNTFINTGMFYDGRYYTNGRPRMQGLTSPSNGSATIKQPAFKWNVAIDPDSDSLTYQIQISVNSSFESPVVDVSNLTTLDFTPPEPLSGLTFYWRVRASDGIGPGNWSEARTFSVDNNPPVSHVNPLPQYSTNSRINVSWSGTDDFSGVANYTIYYSDNNSPYTPWVKSTTRKFTIFNGTDGHKYSFYSLAIDVSGNKEPQKTAPEATTTVDTTAPISSVNPFAQYQTIVPFNVTWTGFDATSGIFNYTIYYFMNDGPPNLWLDNTTATNAQFDGMDGANYSFYSVAWDRAGNIQYEMGDIQTTTVDIIAPVTTVVINGTTYGQEPMYVLPGSTISLKVREKETGVLWTKYILDGGTTTDYSGPISMGDSGSHSFTYWSKDIAGNEEKQKNLLYSVDGQPPSTILSFLGPTIMNDGDTYISSGTLIQLNATDSGTGVSQTKVSIDGLLMPYSGPFKFGSAGNHILIYYSIDNLGLVESANTKILIVDGLPPSTEATFSSKLSRDNIIIHFSASDAGSGVSGIYYRITRENGTKGDFVNGTDAIITALADHSADGRYLIEYFSKDNVGNSDIVHTNEAVIDTIARLSTDIVGNPTVKSASFKFEGESEPGAIISVNGHQISMDSSGGFSYEISLSKGSNTLIISATDPAGNIATEKHHIYYDAGNDNNFIITISMILLVVIAIVAIILSWQLVKKKKRTGG